MMLTQIETEDLETEVLLEAVYRRYGYDFRNYSRVLLKRRMHYFLEKTEYGNLSEMIPRILSDGVMEKKVVRGYIEFSTPTLQYSCTPVR